MVQPSGTTEYRYAADGNLVQRIDSSGTVDFVGQVYERNASTGSVVKRYALGGRLVESRTDGVATALYGDYLHSTVSAGNGATTEYTPFGLVRTSSGTLPTNRQFQGQQHEVGIGLYKMGARWYDPALGLWTQPDTIVPDPSNPQDLNRYAFVRNAPLKYIDASRRCPAPLTTLGPTICFAAFIAPTPVHADPFVAKGAGRDYSPRSSPESSRAWVSIQVESQTVTATSVRTKYDWSHIPGIGQIWPESVHEPSSGNRFLVIF